MSNGNVTRYVTGVRNSAPTQPNPTQPITTVLTSCCSSISKTHSYVSVCNARAGIEMNEVSR